MRSLYFAPFIALLISLAALPALADCSQDTTLRLPRAREGSLGYSRDLKCLYVCDGSTWTNQCDTSSGGGGGPSTPEPTPINLCLEAEDTAVSGNANTIQSTTSPPGGSIRGSLGNASEFLIFNNIPITTAGNYTLQIFYASAEDPTAGVITNGGAINPFYLGTSYIQSNFASWSTVAQRNTSTSLISGANQIRIQGSNSGGAFNLDKICIVGPY